MSKYKLTQKTDANGTTQDLVLDSSCVEQTIVIDLGAWADNGTITQAQANLIQDLTKNVVIKLGDEFFVRFTDVNGTVYDFHSIYRPSISLASEFEIDRVKVNTTNLTWTSQSKTITIPTKTSDLNNDSGFITSSALSSYLKLDGSNTMTGVLNLKASGNNETNIGTNGIRWGTDSLPQDTNPQYICTIDAFASGGRQKWASVSDLRSKLNIPSAVTSVNGLSGGSLTSPLVVKGGDATTAAKISLDHTQSGQITDDGTGTLFGFLSNGATTLTVGGNSYAINLRGTGTRPQYKGNDLALYSDLSGKQDTLVSGTNIKTINGNSVLGSGDITISGGGGVSIKSQSFTGYTGVFDFVNARPRAILGLELSFTENQSFSSGNYASISTSSYATIYSAGINRRLMFESGKTYYFPYQGQETNGYYFAASMNTGEVMGTIRLRNATQHYVNKLQFPTVSSSAININYAFTNLQLTETTTWTIYYLE